MRISYQTLQACRVALTERLDECRAGEQDPSPVVATAWRGERVTVDTALGEVERALAELDLAAVPKVRA